MKKNKLWLTTLLFIITLTACENSDDKEDLNLKRQVIIKLKSSERLKDFMGNSKAQNLKLIDSLKTEPIFLFEFFGDVEFEEVKLSINDLNSLPITEYAEQNSSYDLSTNKVDSVNFGAKKTKNHPSSKAQFQSINFFPQNQFYTNFNPQQWSLQESDILESLSRFKSGRIPINSVIVGVIDSGIDTYHRAFNGALWKNTDEIPNNQIDDDNNGYVDDVNGYNFASNNTNIYDYESHGTHVSGIIAARANSKVDMIGVAPKSQLMVLKYSEGITGSSFAVAKAIEYASENGAQIINMSLGSEDYSQTVYDMVLKAHNQGIYMVAAAGNDSKDLGVTPVYPAALPFVLAIAATDENKNLASYSNFQTVNLWVSKIVSLSAPGTQIFSTLPGNRYGYKSGTSMAAPHVAGTAALIRSLYPQEDFVAINKRLFYGAEFIKALETKVYEGKKLNTYKALFQPKDFVLSNGQPYRNEVINGQARLNRYPYANSGDPGVDGTSWDKAFKITTAKQLTNIREQDLDKYFILMNDIDWSFQSGGVHPNQIFKKFEGKLSGQNFAIYNYKMNSNGPGGLFRNLGPNTSIINLKFMNAEVTSGSNSGILASQSKGAIINNIQIQGQITGNQHVGGLIGYTEGGKIVNCYFEGYVKGNHRIGGLTGSSNLGVEFFRNHVQAEITGSTAGGLTGRLSESIIKESYANIKIQGRDTLGGIAAYSRYSDLINTYSQGSVTAQRYTSGGLVGQINRSTVDKSYSLCEVRSEKYNGGLLGRGRDFIVTSSYFDRSVAAVGAGGVGKSLNQLFQKSTFQGWFNPSNPWSIPSGYHPMLVSIPRSNTTLY